MTLRILSKEKTELVSAFLAAAFVATAPAAATEAPRVPGLLPTLAYPRTVTLAFLDNPQPVCTIQGRGTFTLSNGTQLHYTSKTINSDGSVTLHLEGGGTFTNPAPRDPMLADAVLSMCEN